MKQYKKPNIQVIDLKSLDCFTDGVGVVTPGESGGPILGGETDVTKTTGGWYDEDYDW